jgi:feruloyl-CoA synthase
MDGAEALTAARDPSTAPFKPLPMKGADISVDRRPDGSIVITSNHAPGDGPRTISHLLAQKAAEHPDRPYLKQREPGHGPWRGVTYGQAQRAVEGISQWLLDQGVTADDSVMILSGNSIEHALMTLGAYGAGAPAAPVSPAYSLMSADHGKLKHCFDKVAPKVVFAQSGVMFDKAIATLRAIKPDLLLVTADGVGEGAIAFDTVAATQPRDVAAKRETLTPATVAKYLFTSGSTGMPKGVPQTHAMMAGVIAGQEGLRDEEPSDEIPNSLEWMPWSHISAGNIGFNNVMWAGGTLWIDEGKPLPGMFETTIKNLYEVSPVVFGSAPIAFSMLAGAMESDPVLRKAFFKNLKYMGYGGATLSDDVYTRMQALAVAETGCRVPLTTMYGATETQGVTVVHWLTERVGLVGLPLPGIALKLAPAGGGKYEVRVKGPTVAGGYHRDPEKTAAAFDEEGFYKLGDAARFVDPEDPSKGLVFDGRVTEDFKLDSGTWVSVGVLRPDLVAACSPYIHDAVIAGQDKPFAAAMVWPSPAGLTALVADQGPGTPLDKLTAILRERIGAFNAAAGGSSRRIARVAILTEPPSIDAGEITDKGYVNQRATLDRRAAVVAGLYAKEPGEGVIVI